MVKRKQNHHKIVARIRKPYFDKLNRIRIEYGFKSNYQIMMYLKRLFLKVINPNADDEAITPDELIKMFHDLNNRDRSIADIKPTRGKGLTHRQRFELRNVVAWRKVVLRVSETELKCFQTIAKDYGFNSAYEVAQYIALAFLRTACDTPTSHNKTIEEEADEMFYQYSEADPSRFNYTKSKRKVTSKSLSEH